ncbi:hypothetical protein MRX96_022529 [Rhipicephalus microplus]
MPTTSASMGVQLERREEGAGRPSRSAGFSLHTRSSPVWDGGGSCLAVTELDERGSSSDETPDSAAVVAPHCGHENDVCTLGRADHFLLCVCAGSAGRVRASACACFDGMGFLLRFISAAASHRMMDARLLGTESTAGSQIKKVSGEQTLAK